jgi:hypothetical protein
MSATTTLLATKLRAVRLRAAALPVLLTAGLLARLWLAWTTFLNPDEALHYYLAHQPSLNVAYEASLTTAHPPLMILFLHYWSQLGSSEFFLRLPFVIAGVLFCWLMFLWIGQVASRRAAWFALALLLFLPSLISLSAEIRQYALLLFFCASSLYFLERGLLDKSERSLAASAIALYCALLTHYSALIFAAAAGIYALVRLVRNTRSARITVAWTVMQASALGICAFLFWSQISYLRQSGLPSEIASTWLRSSIFHAGQDQILGFIWSRTTRLFRYFFSHGTIGVLGLLIFIYALVLLLRPRGPRDSKERKPALALLLALPFICALAAAVSGIYPYGGTRHDVLLAMFAIPGIAIGLDQLPAGRFVHSSNWLKFALLALVLIVCNVFSSPSGPYIPPHNQRREQMGEAMTDLHSFPADSALLTDSQGSMVLNYYLCAEAMPLPFAPGTADLGSFRCGNLRVLAANTLAGFDRTAFPSTLNRARQASAQGTLYLFQAGWIDDKEAEWLAELRKLGGSPQNFGPNILLCRFQRAAQ